ncbi:MAG: hypothetical protein ACOYL6_02275 [Bacteriovoracaceae bacterium]
MKLDKEYWEKNYSEPMEMDGIVNAKTHATYLKSIFELEYIGISSIIDLGFGLGHMFREMVMTFEPTKVAGIEPTELGFNEFKNREGALISDYKIKLFQEDLLTWARTDRKVKSRFDLGICTSVLQYLPDEELKEIIPIMAERIKYIYLTVPTDKELLRQVSELNFEDEYAIRRSKSFYYKLLSQHFTFIGSRVLESKSYFNEDTTAFTDLLFRF